MSTLRLAPALLLALAACVVNTDELKPKTDAECAYAPGLKACGNRCMPRTPANGCGNPGCQPCPPAEGSEVFCDEFAACAVRPIPPPGFAYCDGQYDRLMDDLSSNPDHCGACGHGCRGGGCGGGFCSAAWVNNVVGGQDIASDGSTVYWLATGLTAGTQSQASDGGARTWTWVGRATRLEVDPWGMVAWDVILGAPVYATDIPSGSPPAIFYPSGAIRSLSLDPAYAYLVEAGGGPGETPNDLVAVPRIGGPSLGYQFTTETTLTAVASERPSSTLTNIVVGSDQRNLRWVSWDGTASGSYASGVEAPVAMVVFEGFVGPSATTSSRVLFWLGATGGLFRKELPSGPVVTVVPPVATPSTYLDLHADADGIYWVDYTPGYQPFVAEWRAAYDDLLYLALGDPSNPPFRVAATGSGNPYVYWMHTDGSIYGVPK